MSTQWDRIGNAQKTAYPQNMPGAINNRIPFMLVKDAAQNIPKNPGAWNDALESARLQGVDLLAEAIKYGPATGAAIGSLAGPPGMLAGAAIGTVPVVFSQIDKATDGDFSKLLMAGAGNVRSNYAFARDLGSKNAALGVLSGLFTVTGAILGGVGGFAVGGPLGAAAGASLGAATFGKLQREITQTDFVKSNANELYRSSKFAEQDVGQESYNFGRDVTRFAADVTGFKTLGDTTKGIGAITSGILNFGFEVSTGPDVGLFKGVGAVARPALIGAAVTPERTGLFAKVLSKKEAEAAAIRQYEDVQLIKRTVAGEETVYTPVFSAKDKKDAYRYMIVKAMPSLRKCLTENGYNFDEPHDKNKDGLRFQFLIAVGGELFDVDDAALGLVQMTLTLLTNTIATTRHVFFKTHDEVVFADLRIVVVEEVPVILNRQLFTEVD